SSPLRAFPAGDRRGAARIRAPERSGRDLPDPGGEPPHLLLLGAGGAGGLPRRARLRLDPPRPRDPDPPGGGAGPGSPRIRDLPRREVPEGRARPRGMSAVSPPGPVRRAVGSG